MKSFITLFLCCIAFISRAQLDSCNAFLKGDYVEVGINWNGAYGSSVNAPTGFHPKGAAGVKNSAVCGGVCVGSGLNLGFVADPDKDGWTTGSPYAYFGDYFLPGTPQEGWSIQSNDSMANVYNVYGCSTVFPTGVTGSNTNYYITGSTKVAVWEGMYDSLEITQTTELDTTDVFFTVHVKIKNTGHIGRNVYYMRTLDPDNAEPQTGTFTTKNKVEYQLPNPSNKVLLSTWGMSGSTVVANAYLGLGTIDSAAKCMILTGGGLLPYPGVKIDSLYEGFGGKGDTVHNQYRDSTMIDNGIALVFKIGHLVPIDSAIISYTYAFRTGADLDSALASTTRPVPMPIDTTHPGAVAQTKGGNNGITVYPNPPTNEIGITGLTANDIITVYDMMGKNTMTWRASGNGNNNFNISGLPAGMYILRVTDKQGNIKAKIPIQKP